MAEGRQQTSNKDRLMDIGIWASASFSETNAPFPPPGETGAPCFNWERRESHIGGRACCLGYTCCGSIWLGVLWNVFSQTMTVGLKPVALPEGIGIYSRLPRRESSPVESIELVIRPKKSGLSLPKSLPPFPQLFFRSPSGPLHTCEIPCSGGLALGPVEIILRHGGD